MHDALTHPWRIIALVTTLATLLVSSVPAEAQDLHLTSPDGKPVNAEYKAGDVRRPAIVVLHGFLQTREFLTTQTIINGLSSVGNAILSPNLSLGVPDRKQSMQCRAPHQNTFESDLREINTWVQWLRKQGYPSVILVGHSWGSQHSLGYADAYPKEPIVALVNVSLVRSEQTPQVRTRQMAAAKARLARHDMSLQPYNLGFCKDYMARPDTYLSYARWNDAQVLAVLDHLKKRRLPVYVVLGSQDNRSDTQWVKALRVRTREVSVIDGANHFFSALHEFDLNDRLEAIFVQLNTTSQH